MRARRILGNEDAAWKEAVKKYPREFLTWFFPEAAQLIDFARPMQFLDKELAKIAPMPGSKDMAADMLIAAAGIQGQPVLLHVEIQGRKQKEFEKRLHGYWARIRSVLGRTPITLVLLTDMDPSFLPKGYQESGAAHRLEVDFWCAKLMFLPQQSLEDLDRECPLFAVYSCIQLAVNRLRSAGDLQRYEGKFELLVKLVRIGLPVEYTVSVMRFIDRTIQLGDDEEQRLTEALSEKEEGMGVVDILEQKGMREGERKGLLQGERKGLREGERKGLREGKSEGMLAAKQGVLINMMKKKFDLTDSQLSSLNKVQDTQKLDRALDAVLFAASPGEVLDHLK